MAPLDERTNKWMKLGFTTTLLLAVIGSVLLVTMLQAVSHYATQIENHPLENAFDLIFPVVFVAFFSGVCVWLCFRLRYITSIKKWAAFSFVIGSSTYIFLAGVSLMKNFDQIAHDGTSYWGMIYLPCVFIGVPATLIGTIIGSVACLVTHRLRKSKNANPTGRSTHAPREPG
jgi:hypothetical protein